MEYCAHKISMMTKKRTNRQLETKTRLQSKVHHCIYPLFIFDLDLWGYTKYCPVSTTSWDICTCKV